MKPKSLADISPFPAGLLVVTVLLVPQAAWARPISLPPPPNGPKAVPTNTGTASLRDISNYIPGGNPGQAPVIPVNQVQVGTPQPVPFNPQQVLLTPAQGTGVVLPQPRIGGATNPTGNPTINGSNGFTFGQPLPQLNPVGSGFAYPELGNTTLNPAVRGPSLTGSNGQVIPWQTIQQSLPILEGLLNGGGITSVMSGATPLLRNLLGQNLDPRMLGMLQSALPLAQQLMGGNLQGVLSGAMPLLGQFLPQNLAPVFGAIAPLAGQLLSGNVSVSGLLSAGSSLLSLFGQGNPLLGSISGVLGSFGGLFGGSGGSGITLSTPMATVLTPGTNQPGLASMITGGTGTGGTGTGGTPATPSILAQTGTVLCLHQTGCVQSNPGALQSIYATAAGPMGFANPNQVRGRVAELSRAGVLSDAFSSRFNSEQNSYWVGNYTDRELTRARTEAVLSLQGQEDQKKAIDAATQTALTLTQLSDQCAKTSQSSQELIRCNMQINTAGPSFQAAQLTLQHQQQNDLAHQQILLGNISAGIDGMERGTTIDRAAMAARLFKDSTMNFPLARR